MVDDQLQHYFARFLTKTCILTYLVKHEPSVWGKRPWYVYIVCDNGRVFPGMGVTPGGKTDRRLLTACATEKNANAYARRVLRKLCAMANCQQKENHA